MPGQVVFLDVILLVDTPINLHDQALFMAVEVYDAGADGVLAPKYPPPSAGFSPAS